MRILASSLVLAGLLLSSNAARAGDPDESSATAPFSDLGSLGSMGSLGSLGSPRSLGSLADYLQPLNPATRTGEQPADAGKGRLRTYELPAVTVEGEPPAALHEEERIGSYAQPRWTASRRFPNTRIYVIPEGKIEIEYWNRLTFTRNHETEMRNLVELEVGLPYRFQVDVYFRTDSDDIDSHTMYGQQIEVRWALADWGKIWGNPTLYFEYIVLDEDRSDKIEPKLLLGGELAERWHWGVNFVAELEIDGPDYVHEYEFTGGISYSIVDSEFGLGAETKIVFADEKGSRGHFEDEYFLGPSIQWKPIPRLTINFAPLFGLTSDTAYAQVTFNVGWEF